MYQKGEGGVSDSVIKGWTDKELCQPTCPVDFVRDVQAVCSVCVCCAGCMQSACVVQAVCRVCVLCRLCAECVCCVGCLLYRLYAGNGRSVGGFRMQLTKQLIFILLMQPNYKIM